MIIPSSNYNAVELIKKTIFQVTTKILTRDEAPLGKEGYFWSLVSSLAKGGAPLRDAVSKSTCASADELLAMRLLRVKIIMANIELHFRNSAKYTQLNVPGEKENTAGTDQINDTSSDRKVK